MPVHNVSLLGDVTTKPAIGDKSYDKEQSTDDGQHLCPASQIWRPARSHEGKFIESVRDWRRFLGIMGQDVLLNTGYAVAAGKISRILPFAFGLCLAVQLRI